MHDVWFGDEGKKRKTSITAKEKAVIKVSRFAHEPGQKNAVMTNSHSALAEGKTYSVSEKSKILTFSTNAGGSCVKNPWNPAGFLRLFALLPPLIYEKFVIFFVFRYTLAKAPFTPFYLCKSISQWGLACQENFGQGKSKELPHKWVRQLFAKS